MVGTSKGAVVWLVLAVAACGWKPAEPAGERGRHPHDAVHQHARRVGGEAVGIDLVVGDAPQHLGEHDLGLHPGEVHPDAAMATEAEGERHQGIEETRRQRSHEPCSVRTSRGCRR